MNVEQQKFFEKTIPVTESGCWLWEGSLTSGYGATGKGYAHRISYQLFNGSIPDGMHVLHECDIKCCVNPGHLTVGSQKKNMLDAYERGLIPKGKDHFWHREPGRGERHSQAKLTESQVIEIRASKESHTALSKKYGVTVSSIGSIIKRRKWKHVAVTE